MGKSDPASSRPPSQTSFKILVGGPGARQILPAEKQDEWGIDCVIDGEAEANFLPLFQAAVRGEPLPRSVKGESRRMDEIPVTRHRSTLGVVEVTRGCGRGCQFCGVG